MSYEGILNKQEVFFLAAVTSDDSFVYKHNMNLLFKAENSNKHTIIEKKRATRIVINNSKGEMKEKIILSLFFWNGVKDFHCPSFPLIFPFA